MRAFVLKRSRGRMLVAINILHKKHFSMFLLQWVCITGVLISP